MSSSLALASQNLKNNSVGTRSNTSGSGSLMIFNPQDSFTNMFADDYRLTVFKGQSYDIYEHFYTALCESTAKLSICVKFINAFTIDVDLILYIL